MAPDPNRRRSSTTTYCSPLGLTASFLLSRFVSGLLRDVPPNDPLALLAAATARLCVGRLASLIPARLAVRTDLMTALRAE